jgi:4-oxalocrotonate tautomerase
MPLVEITLVEGRTPEQLRALLHEVHAAVVRTCRCPRKAPTGWQRQR